MVTYVNVHKQSLYGSGKEYQQELAFSCISQWCYLFKMFVFLVWHVVIFAQDINRAWGNLEGAEKDFEDWLLKEMRRWDLILIIECHCQRKPGSTKTVRSAVYLHLFTVQKLSEKINNHDICRGRCLFFFEISPHHDFGLSSSQKWPKFQAILGEPKRYFVQIPETLIFVG